MLHGLKIAKSLENERRMLQIEIEVEQNAERVNQLFSAQLELEQTIHRIRSATNARFAVTVVLGTLVGILLTGLLTAGKMNSGGVALFSIALSWTVIYKTARKWVIRPWPEQLN